MVRSRQAQTTEPDPQEPVLEWVPYKPTGGKLRVTHTSCCGRYEFASEGGHFFVLRPIADDCYEETGRGLYRQALDAYIALAERHRDEHWSRRERPQPDTFLKMG